MATFEDIAEARAAARPTERLPVVRFRDGHRTGGADVVTGEEPLEIRLDGGAVAVTMRTPVPGQDAELALGFLLGEAIVTADQVARVQECTSEGGDGGIADVRLRPGAEAFDGWQRRFYATSSCGICGKASVDAVRVTAGALPDGPHLDARTIAELPAELRRAQRVFDRTGGLHAAAIFDVDGRALIVREDVGRHNAVDKAVGRAAMDGLLPLSNHALMVSGRASFEIIQKAVMAAIPIVAAVSAPSTLAVQLARESNVTLLGFVRDGGFNAYAGVARIVSSP